MAQRLRARPDLSGVAPYVSPQLPARIRLNTNESPYPPPQAVIVEATAALNSVALNRYPDRDATSLYDALAGHTGRPREGLWVANGSNEVFLHLFLAFGGAGRRSLTFEPTYSLHTLIARIAATRTTGRRRAENWSVDLEVALEAIESERPEIVVLCSPNNPTGTLEALGTVRELAARAPGLVVVDEAYAEFASSSASAVGLLSEHSNLVVVRTFSKAWALAGVRLGYMLAAPEVIAEMATVRLPYLLSAPTQAFGLAALAHASEAAEAARAVIRERDRLMVELAGLGLKTWPSHANFVLFEVGDAGAVYERLLARGVLVRSYEGRPGLESCLRTTVGLPHETDELLSALAEALDG
ncbi:MAG: histidinol-phosphate transaminase [Actinomycetota bacterium]|nr:histidinol-phosphate transaminase [Actinomycetota bacterium]